MVSFKDLTAGIGGTPAYTQVVTKIRNDLDASIPKELRLPSTLLDDLPVDVSTVPETCGLLSPQELAITELDATALRDKIASGDLTAVDAVTAFGKRAVIVHQVTSCLTEIFLDEGIAMAKALDEEFKRTGKTVGPMHGVPMPIKAHIPIKGHYSDAGFLATRELSEDDCDVVALFRSLGAVFYVKTTQPQAIMHLECHSYLSRTLNPFNTRLSCGGSTGGTGALVGAKGAPWGIGTDIGGSIRVPCAHNGLFGMRPTCLQLPMRGMIHTGKGWSGVAASSGPMCNSSRDVITFNSALLEAKPYQNDVFLDPSGWFGQPSLPEGRKLKLGILIHDDMVVPHPPVLRALETAKAKLAKHPNVELVDFKAYKHNLGWELTQELYYPDGAQILNSLLAETGEDKSPMTRFISGGHVKDHSSVEIMELLLQRDKYRDEYFAHWKKTGVDAVLCPIFPGSAPPHDHSTYWQYSSTWNILDYPGVIFPTGLTVDPGLDPKPTDFKPLSAADQANYDLYDPNLQIKAPISLQVVASKWNDAIALGAQILIEEALKA